jgi:hypothetical protein
VELPSFQLCSAAKPAPSLLIPVGVSSPQKHLLHPRVRAISMACPEMPFRRNTVLFETAHMAVLIGKKKHALTEEIPDERRSASYPCLAIHAGSSKHGQATDADYLRILPAVTLATSRRTRVPANTVADPEIRPIGPATPRASWMCTAFCLFLVDMVVFGRSAGTDRKNRVGTGAEVNACWRP